MAIQKVKLELIDDNPYQPRSSYPTNALEELAHSIKEIGMRQIPEARQSNGHFQLAYGHMRLRAYKKLAKKGKGWEEMPLDVKPLTDDVMCLLALEENIRRQDITPIDIARSVEMYLSNFKKTTETELARKLKMTQGNLSNMRRVLRLPEEILVKIDEGKINFTMGRELLVFEGVSGVGAEERWSRKEQRTVKIPKDSKWLMLQAIKGLSSEGYSSCPFTVDGIKKSIYQVCCSNLRHLEKGVGYSWNNQDPLFDTRAEGCLKCDNMIRANETKSTVRHFCINQECWDKKQEKHIRQAAAKAKKQQEADIAKRIREAEANKSADISQEITPDDDIDETAECYREAMAAEQDLDDEYFDKAEENHVDKETAEAIPLEQRGEALRTWQNFINDPRELPCRRCLNAGLCDGTSKRLDGKGEEEKWVCHKLTPVGTVEAVSAKARRNIPKALEGMDKDAAGTRAEILDIRALRNSSYGYELKQGHIWLTDFDRMEDSKECLERCTKGFHYGYDSEGRSSEVLYICTNPKCVSKKKAAFTRTKNARGNAKKKAEMAAIKEAVEKTITLDKPRMVLILQTQLSGRHCSSYSYRDTASETLGKLLGVEIKVEGWDPDRGKKLDEAFSKALNKLSEEELAKVVVEFMLRMLTYDGDIKDYKVRTTSVLNGMGVGINIPTPVEKKAS